MKKNINWFVALVAIMLGWTLFKQFDFQNLTFEKPALAGLYMLVFVTSIYLLIRDYRKRPEK